MRLFLLSFFSAVFFFADAQTCAIDSNNFELLSPVNDSLPCVYRGEPYSAIINLFAPPEIGGTVIDSIIVTSFFGYPSGMSYSCNPSTCSITGFSWACINISGVTTDTVGSYEIGYTGYVRTNTGTFTFDDLQGFGFLPVYILDVIEYGDACKGVVSKVEKNSRIAGLTISPNPSTGLITANWEQTDFASSTITITNMIGAVVYQKEQQPGFLQQTNIDVQHLNQGVYFLRISSKMGDVVKKIAIK
jgi:hypothetical protein